MKPRAPEKKAKVNLLKGLGGTLALSFLLFALTPMVVVSVISYLNAHGSLIKETEIALKTAAVLKTREIRAYFDGMVTDLRHQAETDSTTRLLEELVNGWQASGKPPVEFTKSHPWTNVVDEFASDIKKFRKEYNYYNIFLISREGGILYTEADENDLGANLFTGRYSGSKSCPPPEVIWRRFPPSTSISQMFRSDAPGGRIEKRILCPSNETQGSETLAPV